MRPVAPARYGFALFFRRARLPGRAIFAAAVFTSAAIPIST